MDRFRQWLQYYLGVSELPTKAHLAVHEKTCRDRHDELMRFLGVMANRLDVIEANFTNQHVGQRRPAGGVKDWEQVQIEMLQEMMANPPKEDN